MSLSLTLADLLAQHWHSYARKHRNHLCGAHYRAVRSVLQCRTPQLGGRLYRCGDCHKPHFAYHSCNHRSCPQCGASEQQLWTAKQEARLLPVPYFMVTFTIPSELRPVCKRYPKELYHLLMSCSAQAIKDIIATKYQGTTTGFTSILHTWGRQLQHHPHIHTIIPAIALKENQIVRPKQDAFLIHYKPLAARFRSLIHSTLESQNPEVYQNLTPAQRHSLSPKTQWNVQLQHVGKGKTALRYLARYVCRSGFTNKRLIGYDKSGNNVLLKWTPSGTSETKILKLTIHEFIRRWLIHVLPKGFLRVRHYGFLSSAAVKTRTKLWLLLGQQEPQLILPEPQSFTCPHCDGELHYLRDIPSPIFTRGPPLTKTA